MKKFSFTLLGLLLSLPVLPAFADTVHHEIDVSLEPQTHLLAVTDRVLLGAEGRHSESSGEMLVFALHKGLSPVSRTAGVVVVPFPKSARSEPVEEAIHEYYQLVLPAGTTEFTLQYSGEIYHPLSAETDEYARGFRDTPGLIGPEGVYLAGSSYWYPRFAEELVSFSLNVSMPAGWDSVSQGDRVAHELAERTRARWSSPELQDDIYLIGGQFTEYQRPADATGTSSLAFLRTPDPELAEKYLSATANYIDMYNGLIGPYPFRKFALVENFWETGYGMPSFTLLGPKIIRFPFILQSSYPHEILHNWWGNSVYVDYATGNWCEGLTAYLADHLLKEQVGGGAEYRRDTLQKYSSYVTTGNDFPLTEFRERHNAATEAVGYGKAQSFYHMLRRNLGDEVFVRGLQDFYSRQKFHRAGYRDLRASMERASGLDLRSEFEQWVTRTGAPELRLSGRPSARSNQNGGYELTFTLGQIQGAPEYRLRVPVAVDIENQEKALQLVIEMNSRSLSVTVQVPGKPLRVNVDPEFDLFRRLDPEEVPPSISRALGAQKVLVVVPAGASPAMREAYTELARQWVGAEELSPERAVRLDSELSSLPGDRTVWILGWENRFVAEAEAALAPYGVNATDNGVSLGSAEYSRVRHAFVATAPNPLQPAEVLGWTAVSDAQGAAGVAAVGRKLPHYGKYGYLAFESDEAKNIGKGIWPAIHSPMSAVVSFADGTVGSGPKGKLAPRAPLATLPDVFDRAQMRSTVEWLTREAIKGRELGTPELDQVSEFLAAKLRSFGIMPGAPQGYFQTWTETLAPPKGEIQITNVVGMIPGKDPTLPAVVLGAHYDHIGLGWPDVHSGNEGKVHPGADDNASGVAVVLELARLYGERLRAGVLPERGIVFALFSGEEAGILGSRHFVRDAARPARSMMAMVNLDTVGRLGSGKLQVIGTSSAKEWNPLFQGVGYTTGVPLTLIADDFGSSDQRSFQLAGIPAVQLFSGAHLDMHRPTDTADKLDYPGLVSVAKVARETVDYLASRREPLTGGNGGGGPIQPPPSGERKAFLGTVPDFAFPGPGVRISQVITGSPAEKAGLMAEDIVVRMKDTSIGNLRDYSAVLKTLKPGDEVTIMYLRAGSELTTRATVTER